MKIAVGMGCDRGAPLTSVCAALDEALQQIGATDDAICVFATIDKKSDEAAFLQLALLRPAPWRFYSAEELATVQVPNPSATVLHYMGTPAVAEAAALLAAQTDQSHLLVEKHKYRGADGKHVTISLVRIST
ncbi:MAG: cobalamin biosynthesis protein [Aestuariibacter sp.]|nr:cobalamin biosynthesis protein [Aestuariibacter sp.]MCP5017445.1 cobalamin biosynthesis protein [Ketobacter sp.]